MKAPRFYNGQKVVALITTDNTQGVGITKDKVYVVKSTIFCSCGDECVDIGLVGKGWALCSEDHRLQVRDICFVDADLLAPIIEIKERAFKKMTYKETVEEVEKVLETSLN